jgi:uncharacterized protein
MSSPFVSWMGRLELDHPDKVKDIPRDKDALLELLAQKGGAHETDYLHQLENEYGKDQVITIEKGFNAAESTKKAMSEGCSVIFQAYLERDDFKGYSDFLIKRSGKSDLGDYYYEVWDTKLSKTTRTYFIVQLCCYSWMVDKIQGRLPEEVVVVLGDKKEDRIRIAPYFAYFLNLKKQFLTAQESFVGEMRDMPDPAYCNDFGKWGTFAKQILQESDSLSIVANIRKSQIKKLRDSGINTLTELVNSKLDYIKGVSKETLYKIKAQAKIQLESRSELKPKFEVLNTEPGKGLSALPPASNLDIFFDIEGHPLMDGGLEYLWGVSYADKGAVLGKNYPFKDWWAHDQTQEKLAFEGFIDWTYARWQADKLMHVYHYSSYEITAIKKMVNRYETRELEVQTLFENKVFIDLYRIVQNGLLIGEPKYSIKNVEHLYRESRNTVVANGSESVVFYEKWRESGGVDAWRNSPLGYQSWNQQLEEFDWSKWSELNEIRDYNIDDCESTLELVEWLHQLQKEKGIKYEPVTPKLLVEVDPTDRVIANRENREALQNLQKKLVEIFKNNVELNKDKYAQLLISLLHFYERERKSKNFEYFLRLEKNDEELSDDDMVISNIDLESISSQDGKILCTAKFSLDQPLRKDKIKSAVIKDSNVKVNKISFHEIVNPGEEIDLHFGLIAFELNAEHIDILDLKPLTLFGSEDFLSTDGLEKELCRVTEEYFTNRQLSNALKTIFDQAAPRFLSDLALLPVTRQNYSDDKKYDEALINAIAGMNESCLCIQGPPGSGKTYTAKKVIKALLKNGKRIGIMSNSHAAIMNLLGPLAEDLRDVAIAKITGFESNKVFEEKFPTDTYPLFKYRSSMSFTQKQPFESFQVLGATVYGFSNAITHEYPFDYLFVDEASQVALANLVVASSAAKNIVLMGDQMQLEQPIQGSHPGSAGASALEFMLQEYAVIPEDKGIFLERTYRMHQDICTPLSEIVYEGKLQADDANSNQKIEINSPRIVTKEKGILPILVEHSGNTQSSEEEVEKIKEIIAELKTGYFINKDQKSEPITNKSILIIAPYNLQVNLLKERLGLEYQIGTIDKFQGQEAPVVIVSMAVSDIADTPRGLDFIFDKKRLNVAISRAKALAIIVANKGLTNCVVTNLSQMEKVGFFSRLTMDSTNN